MKRSLIKHHQYIPRLLKRLSEGSISSQCSDSKEKDDNWRQTKAMMSPSIQNHILINPALTVPGNLER
ncbi:hypothetical protein JZ751_024568 [Albula glossodonta]|uniref:Uncharacterized protein n=1 Tax=Albula glossodonta TaxID=121402 RepID=A0A8T2PEQ1_9TELE|nr:hypothetical protein JZ751_024568 [Albula glossodonta]